jgi:hypothetical protein
LEHVVVSGVQFGRRQDRDRLLVEPEKLDDVADDLREYKAIAARHHRHRARPKPPQLLKAALVCQYIN